MQGACGVHRNISQVVKEGIVYLEKVTANTSSYQRRWLLAEKNVLATDPIEAFTADKLRPASIQAVEAQVSYKIRMENVFGDEAGQFP